MDPRFVRPEDRSRIAGLSAVAAGADALPDLYRSEGFAEDLPQDLTAVVTPAAAPSAPPAGGRRATDFLPPQGLAALPPRRPWGGLRLARG